MRVHAQTHRPARLPGSYLQPRGCVINDNQSCRRPGIPRCRMDPPIGNLRNRAGLKPGRWRECKFALPPPVVPASPGTQRGTNPTIPAPLPCRRIRGTPVIRPRALTSLRATTQEDCIDDERWKILPQQTGAVVYPDPTTRVPGYGGEHPRGGPATAHHPVARADHRRPPPV